MDVFSEMQRTIKWFLAGCGDGEREQRDGGDRQ